MPAAHVPSGKIPDSPEPEAAASGSPTPAEPSLAGRRLGRPRIGETPLSAEGFFDKLARVESWEDNQVWIYRIEPITDRVGQGKAKFIRIWAEACDENKIMHTEGSGVYSLLWKQRSQPGGPLIPHEKYERLEIENKDYPPRIEAGDWLDDQRNRRWAFARKYYEAEVKKEEQRNAPAQPPMTVQDTIALVEQAIEKKMAHSPKDDTILSAMTLAFEQARAATPPPDASMGTLVQILSAQTNAANDRAAKMEERFLTLLTDRAKPAATLSPEDEVQRMAKTVKALDEILPRRGASRAPDPDHPGWGILDTTVKAIAPGVNMLLGVLAQKIQQAPVQPGQQPPPAGQPQAQVHQPPNNPTGGVPVFDMSIIPPVLRDHFFIALQWCFDKGEPGGSFADWLNATWPDAIRAMRMIGSEPNMPWTIGGNPEVSTPVDAMIWIGKQVGPLWAQVASRPNGEAHLRAFITDMLAWTPGQEQQQEEEEPGHGPN